MLRKFNFKVIFCLFLFVLPLTLPGVGMCADEPEAHETRGPNEVRLAAWNIKFLGGGYFGWKIRNKSELRDVAKIISRYDFIAITEVMWNTGQLKKVLKRLGKMGYGYSCLITEEIGRWNYKERYAFLYRTDLIKLVNKGDFYPDPDDGFDRHPYWATFRAGNFDFTVVVVHALAEDEDDIDHIEENKRLVQVYEHIQKLNPDEKDILLVGDFNLSYFRDLPKKEFNEIWTTVNPKFTPLFSFDNKEHRTNIRDDKLYDNIFFQEAHLNEYARNSGIFRFDDVMFGGDDGKAGRVSDHRPVWADFKTDLEDDD